MKTGDVIQMLADKLNINRKDAKVIAFPYLYGIPNGITRLIKDYQLEE